MYACDFDRKRGHPQSLHVCMFDRLCLSLCLFNSPCGCTYFMSMSLSLSVCLYLRSHLPINHAVPIFSSSSIVHSVSIYCNSPCASICYLSLSCLLLSLHISLCFRNFIICHSVSFYRVVAIFSLSLYVYVYLKYLALSPSIALFLFVTLLYTSPCSNTYLSLSVYISVFRLFLVLCSVSICHSV